MKILRYDVGNKPELGIETSKGQVISCNEITKTLGLSQVKTIQDIIDNWNGDLINRIGQLVENMDGYDVTNVRLLTPIPWTKRNVFCLGKNYLEHAKELSNTSENLKGIPENPIYFTKTASPAIGPGDPIRLFPELTDGEVDYEVELAVIIGKQGVNIKAEEAYDHLFGYTILNDISARKLQIKHAQWFRGKCLDTHTVIGPAVVHKSKFSFPPHLALGTRVNGEVRQDANTDLMIFDIATIIADLSKETTLYPGDIISTGTPAGVGMGFTPPKYLKKGDVVECWIEGIGSLTNPVED